MRRQPPLLLPLFRSDGQARLLARVYLFPDRLVADSDPTGGFVMAYDATRKVIAAHMRARGLRVRKGPAEIGP